METLVNFLGNRHIKTNILLGADNPFLSESDRLTYPNHYILFLTNNSHCLSFIFSTHSALNSALVYDCRNNRDYQENNPSTEGILEDLADILSEFVDISFEDWVKNTSYTDSEIALKYFIRNKQLTSRVRFILGEKNFKDFLALSESRYTEPREYGALFIS